MALNNSDIRESDDELEFHVHDEERGRWANKREFILSSIGYAVGTGNVWRFPYLAYRSGGGAFLIPYLLMLFLCGIPLFFMEIIIGQFSSTGAVSMFRMTPLLKGAGYAMAVVNMITTSYYSVIITYPLLFAFETLQKTIPWMTCDNEWNTKNCVVITEFSNITVNGSEQQTTSADEFFHRKILRISDGIHDLGGINWPLFYCLLVTWFCITGAIIKGVKSVGKVVYFTAIFPILVLIILFIRGVTLPGAVHGIIFYIKPTWEKLLDLNTWADAAIQIFYSLGPGWGGIVNMASYNSFNNNAFWDSITIPFVNSFTSIFAGFTVFSVLGFLSERTGKTVANVATAGPGLAFVTYPEAIALMPLPHLWAMLFFLMLFFLGLDSVFVQIEAVVSSILDDNKWLRKYKLAVVFSICFFLFLVSTIMTTFGGMYIVQVLDWYSASISIILICIVESVMVVYIYGMKRFKDDIFFMTGKYPNKVLIYILNYITPFVLVFIFLTSIIFNRNVTYNLYIYPVWAIALGWFSCGLSISLIPIYILYLLISKKGSWLYILKTYSQAYDWTPASPQTRLLYTEFLNRRKMKNIELETRGVKKN